MLTRHGQIVKLFIIFAALALVLPACSDDDAPSDEPIAVESTLPANNHGEAGVPYTFSFVYDADAITAPDVAMQAGLRGNPVAAARDAHARVLRQAATRPKTVTFTWVFGDGTPAGTHTVPLDGRFARWDTEHTYHVDGRYGLVASAQNEDGDVLASTDFIVTIGDIEEEERELNICDEWQAGEEGGYGVTITNWDISDVPANAIFDIRYDAYGIPDKFIVEYPFGAKVLDTGWRGGAGYDNNPLYPGGVVSPGHDEKLDIFTKSSGTNKFKVTVIGPGSGTVWDYEIRCRIP